MDGMTFETDREHMEHYLAEADKRYIIRKDKADKPPFMKLLDDLIDFLKDKNATLEKINEALEDDDDEAE